eukprot:4480170-Pyramimonas_sp.AAC.1
MGAHRKSDTSLPKFAGHHSGDNHAVFSASMSDAAVGRQNTSKQWMRRSPHGPGIILPLSSWKLCELLVVLVQGGKAEIVEASVAMGPHQLLGHWRLQVPLELVLVVEGVQVEGP